ncbi:branched-chain amino acid ABC transporter permease [Mesorhizobium sp. M2D.F.Ca.ET.185.01.1.1]|uniref:branched-chain amino acid ABC transporter permease n=1 Tax=unclassified Mesorhizobium TaxID=325217 RepID=UPI000FCC1553|nr:MULTISPECIES: branched-chain amino acid ABC transporter permease [unclassified Mesorhizobium]TGP82235.1 branched-chain amino acid ABC transporter permease [bacterium M00.F.Ca.ET.227.01.1.1]TGP91881.1 branched-chain amino acid ABC transporter permease [bacterium M00.F.Ca.ET.221.01.1.1]TGP95333.1 branched-chain amino acid ABC transporter permease [bacterium M00.F.Ca.ET.222.01.1.1]TGU03671.1 branched-chain amino acid ABC transporter permease [bacterium M00.F.Ca.ET.163.01.1.1]TGU38737.1 branche
MLYFFQQVLNGLHSGALYALLAFGYVLTNGILHRTNLAHGALFAFCGQTMILTAAFGYQALWLTLAAAVALGAAAAVLYAALISHVLSRSVFERLADRSPNAIVVTTLGILIFLSEASRIAADTHDLWLPPMLATPVIFAEADGFKVTLTVIQLLDCAGVVTLVALAAWLFSHSSFGRAWRAVSDDPKAAAMCGVDVTAVFRRAVLFGGFCAALAGVLAGLYYGNVSFGTGLVYGLKILFVTAVGGYLSPLKAALGAAAFGMAESLWAGYFPLEWRDAWIYLFLVVMLVLIGAGRDQAKIA